ncbi:MAG TPA: hypothetical protein VMT98_16165 [Verrucomicrobiae bacterium]|nr:hypothetical protein [Verrucomicrobiae bacterium]
MADLLDIAPATAVEVVRINGERYTVRGLHGNAIASIVARFPNLGLLIGGGADIGTRMIEQAGNAIGPIIAAGCGHLGDEKAEKIASELLIEDQLKFLKAILGLTFPNGLSSFVQELTGLIGGAREEQKTVKVRLRKSPSPSQPSSGAASPPTMQ